MQAGPTFDERARYGMRARIARAVVDSPSGSSAASSDAQRAARARTRARARRRRGRATPGGSAARRTARGRGDTRSRPARRAAPRLLRRRHAPSSRSRTTPRFRRHSASSWRARVKFWRNVLSRMPSERRELVVVATAGAREPRVERLARLGRAACRGSLRSRRAASDPARHGRLRARPAPPRDRRARDGVARSPAHLADGEVARDPHGEPEEAVRPAVGDEPRRHLPHAQQRLLQHGLDVDHRRERAQALAHRPLGAGEPAPERVRVAGDDRREVNVEVHHSTIHQSEGRDQREQEQHEREEARRRLDAPASGTASIGRLGRRRAARRTAFVGRRLGRPGRHRRRTLDAPTRSTAATGSSAPRRRRSPPTIIVIEGGGRLAAGLASPAAQAEARRRRAVRQLLRHDLVRAPGRSTTRRSSIAIHDVRRVAIWNVERRASSISRSSVLARPSSAPRGPRRARGRTARRSPGCPRPAARAGTRTRCSHVPARELRRARRARRPRARSASAATIGAPSNTSGMCSGACATARCPRSRRSVSIGDRVRSISRFAAALGVLVDADQHLDAAAGARERRRERAVDRRADAEHVQPARLRQPVVQQLDDLLLAADVAVGHDDRPGAARRAAARAAPRARRSPSRCRRPPGATAPTGSPRASPRGRGHRLARVAARAVRELDQLEPVLLAERVDHAARRPASPCRAGRRPSSRWCRAGRSDRARPPPPSPSRAGGTIVSSPYASPLARRARGERQPDLGGRDRPAHDDVAIEPRARPRRAIATPAARRAQRVRRRRTASPPPASASPIASSICDPRADLPRRDLRRASRARPRRCRARRRSAARSPSGTAAPTRPRAATRAAGRSVIRATIASPRRDVADLLREDVGALLLEQRRGVALRDRALEPLARLGLALSTRPAITRPADLERVARSPRRRPAAASGT